MGNIAFFSIPLFGHINYGLKIAARLMKRGHSIYYYSGIAFKDYIEQKGVQFCQYSDEIEQLFSQGSTYNPQATKAIDNKKVDYYQEIYYLGIHLFTITDIFMKKDIKELEKKNLNAVVFDNIAIWGKLIAKKLGILSFASGTPYCFNAKMIETYPEEFAKFILQEHDFSYDCVTPFIRICNKKLWRMYPELKEVSILDNYGGCGDFNFIYTSSRFQMHADLIDQKKNRFTGILVDEDDIKEDIEVYIEKDKKNIYISFGTIYNSTVLYQVCINALKDMDVNVLLSIGKANDASDFVSLPDNWHVRKNWPQIKVLQNIDVFISHGGNNSIREAANFGVPTLIIPQTGDHYLTAEDIKKNNMGIVIEGDVHEDILKESVYKCLYDEAIKQNCMEVAKEMQQLGGLSQVVEDIENYMERGGIYD
ncbi:nucleotide disphospho-sugar-binding domain-containing protein [Zhenhengia yiwuensis]|uniref:Erythromycin biosynthesis protein CIII-like C-terminal domain-containing protein n=1 Tax=Zhenhengia yiwuensis TaxID=2763666 RepID=A0A926EME1_9FIRM|nr:nucleotide disphospho-sugar-binding domain-containing protein [Zhenhengia yiwuensis]MBC8580757.1 hypothetical protein [Zhenhengia yiwuensis]